jgi:cell division septal protein FtsQ
MKWKFRVPRMPRVSWRVLAWAGAAMLVMVAWMTAPLALRRLTFFRVRQVEIVGIRYLSAERVLAALQLSPSASVFDETGVLAGRLRGLSGIADASVIRRPPASLRVIVRETEPVALVEDARGALEVVGADAQPLPFDPAGPGAGANGGPLDLPIVRAGGEDSGVVGLLARMQAVDPTLFQAIDAAQGLERRADSPAGDVVLELGSHRVLLSRDAGPEVIQAVVLVARDLAAKKRRYDELDARYAGQVIVRRRSSAGGRSV